MFDDLLTRLGIAKTNSGVYAGRWIEKPGGEELVSLNPARGEPIARATAAARADCKMAIDSAAAAFKSWRVVPAPVRGEIVRQIGMALREQKEDLGLLVTLE